MLAESADEIPVMVAISQAPSKPRFKCVLVDKRNRFDTVFQELLEKEEDDYSSLSTPDIKVSCSESGNIFPFNNRVTLDQASKMLRSDILWVHFEFSERNIFEA